MTIRRRLPFSLSFLLFRIRIIFHSSFMYFFAESRMHEDDMQSRTIRNGRCVMEAAITVYLCYIVVLTRIWNGFLMCGRRRSISLLVDGEETIHSCCYVMAACGCDIWQIKLSPISICLIPFIFLISVKSAAAIHWTAGRGEIDQRRSRCVERCSRD